MKDTCFKCSSGSDRCYFTKAVPVLDIPREERSSCVELELILYNNPSFQSELSYWTIWNVPTDGNCWVYSICSSLFYQHSKTVQPDTLRKDMASVIRTLGDERFIVEVHSISVLEEQNVYVPSFSHKLEKRKLIFQVLETKLLSFLK